MTFRLFLAVLAAFLAVDFCTAQKLSAPSKASKAEAEGADREAQELVREILSQKPEKQTAMEGVLKIRDASGKRLEVPLKYTIVPEEFGWRGVYEARSTPWRGAERLVIIHHEAQSNRYIHSAAGGPGEAPKQPVTLTGAQAAVPFAGSDYWLCDLGMEFLYWPQQRLVREAKIKMRQNRPCKVIESTSPNPGATKYARVVSWLDAESGAPIYAEGFDANSKRFKIFSLHGFTKANGRWQPKELEMLDERTDSRTRLEFSVETPEP